MFCRDILKKKNFIYFSLKYETVNAQGHLFYRPNCYRKISCFITEICGGIAQYTAWVRTKPKWLRFSDRRKSMHGTYLTYMYACGRQCLYQCRSRHTQKNKNSQGYSIMVLCYTYKHSMTVCMSHTESWFFFL